MRCARTQWVDNGPGWVAALLDSREAVLALQPDLAAMGDLELGVVGRGRRRAREAQFEVRAFVPSVGVGEDPVTGSLNAGLAQWLIGAGLAPTTTLPARARCSVAPAGSMSTGSAPTSGSAATPSSAWMAT
jgi:predicted PhzF superfamily epimerase YddE/YHI9